jgi:hypothetical protein
MGAFVWFIIQGKTEGNAVVQTLEARQGLFAVQRWIARGTDRSIGTFGGLNEIQLSPPIKTKAKIWLPAKRSNGGVRRKRN